MLPADTYALAWQALCSAANTFPCNAGLIPKTTAVCLQGLVCAAVILVPGIFSLLLLQRLPKDGRVAPGAIMSYEEQQQQQMYDGQQGPTDAQLPEPHWPEANM
jgi:hypothetical protein